MHCLKSRGAMGGQGRRSGGWSRPNVERFHGGLISSFYPPKGFLTDWSIWHRFAALKVNPADACKSSVYQVRATGADGNTVAIPRACRVDAEGVLRAGLCPMAL